MTVTPVSTTNPMAVADFVAVVTMALPPLLVAEEVREEPLLPVSPGRGAHAVGSPFWSDLERSEEAGVETANEVVEVHMSPKLAEAHA